MIPDRPFDPGLQPERTLLAWRRTALALAGGSIVAGRLALTTIGLSAAAFAMVGILGAGLTYIMASRPDRLNHESLTSERSQLAGDAVALAVTALASITIALAGLTYVILAHR